MSDRQEQPPGHDKEMDLPIEAFDVCSRIEQARDLVAAVTGLEVLAHRAVSDAVMATISLSSDRPWNFDIELPEGTKSHISRDDEIVTENPGRFVATELTSMGEHGVEFYNRSTDERLRISGFNFEISPVSLSSSQN